MKHVVGEEEVVSTTIQFLKRRHLVLFEILLGTLDIFMELAAKI